MVAGFDAGVEEVTLIGRGRHCLLETTRFVETKVEGLGLAQNCFRQRIGSIGRSGIHTIDRSGWL